MAKITTKPIETVYDAVSSSETQQAGYNVVAEGGYLILVLNSELKPPATDTKHVSQVYGVFTFPPTRELGVEFYSHLEALLEEGAIRVRKLPP